MTTDISSEQDQAFREMVQLGEEIQGPPPETFNDIVTRLWDQYTDGMPDDTRRSKKNQAATGAAIASDIISRLCLDDTALVILQPVIHDAVRHRIRAIEIGKQQDARKGKPTRKLQARRDRAGDNLTYHPQSGPMPDIKDPLVFLELNVTINGVTKKWKNFTVAELESRRVGASRHAKAAFLTERSNAWAIRMCEQFGVKTLGDIDKGELLKNLPDKSDFQIRP